MWKTNQEPQKPWKQTWNHEKPTRNHGKSWKPTWNHKKTNLKPCKTMNTDLKRWKSNRKRWKTMKTHPEPWKTMENQPWTMKNHENRPGRAGINKNVTNRQTDRQNLPIIYRSWKIAIIQSWEEGWFEKYAPCGNLEGRDLLTIYNFNTLYRKLYWQYVILIRSIKND